MVGAGAGMPAANLNSARGICKTGPRVKITALSKQLPNSRTFPGQCHCTRAWHSFRRNGFNPFVHPSRMFCDEMANERRNVLASITQRWNSDREDPEPIVEIIAETAFCHHLS